MEALSLKKNMLWNSVGSLVYLGCQWLVTVFVARMAPDYESAGVLALAMAISNIFAHIALYRIRTYQVTDVNKSVSAQEYVAFRLITIAVGGIGISIYIFATCDPSVFLPVFLYLVFRAGEVFIDMLHGVDQQNFRMDYCGKSLFARGVLFLVAFLAVFGLTHNLSLAIVGMILVTYPVIIYDARKAAQFDKLKPSITKHRAFELAKICLPAVLGSVFYIAVNSLARQYLQIHSGEEALGIYASVCTPAVILQAGASYLYSPILGVFAKHYLNKDVKAFNRLLGMVTGGIIGLFVLCLIGFYFAGEPLLDFAFGESILAYVYLLYPALLCVMLTAYVSFMSDVMVTVRDMRGNVIANGIGFVISLPATYFCVAAWDMNGVSYSVSIAYFVAIVIMLGFLFVRMREVAREASLDKAQ